MKFKKALFNKQRSYIEDDSPVDIPSDLSSETFEECSREEII